MNRMSVQDATFLHIESDDRPMHVGGVSIFEGPPPPFDEVKAMVEGKLALVPRYRQVVRFVPLALARPVWVDDPHFNLGYHVRRTALPPREWEVWRLRQLVARFEDFLRCHPTRTTCVESGHYVRDVARSEERCSAE